MISNFTVRAVRAGGGRTTAESSSRSLKGRFEDVATVDEETVASVESSAVIRTILEAVTTVEDAVVLAEDDELAVK